MNKLEELLKETDYTTEEWLMHQKVEKHCQLCDLEYVLTDMLEQEEITQEQYNKACEDAEWIFVKYNKWLDYDWYDTMKDAVAYVLEEED